MCMEHGRTLVVLGDELGPLLVDNYRETHDPHGRSPISLHGVSRMAIFQGSLRRVQKGYCIDRTVQRTSTLGRTRSRPLGPDAEPNRRDEGGRGSRRGYTVRPEVLHPDPDEHFALDDGHLHLVIHRLVHNLAQDGHLHHTCDPECVPVNRLRLPGRGDQLCGG